MVILAFHPGKGPVDAGDHVGWMVLRLLAETVNIPHTLANPEVIVHLQTACLRPVRAVRVQLVDAAASLHFRVDQVQQVGHRTVVFGRLFEDCHLIRRRFRDPLLGVGYVTPVVVEPVQFIVFKNPDHPRQQVGAPTGAGRRTPRQVPPTGDCVARSRPFLAVVGILPREITTRRIGENLHALARAPSRQTGETRPD